MATVDEPPAERWSSSAIHVDELANEDEVTRFPRDLYTGPPPIPAPDRAEPSSSERAAASTIDRYHRERLPHQDQMRGLLVLLLIGPIPVIALLAIVAGFVQRPEAQNVAERLLATFVPLAAGILGFYFARRSASGDL
jgi:hypothetical protein